MESPGNLDLSSVSDHDLIRRFCATPPDMAAGDELSNRCLPKIRQTIKWEVFNKEFCPPQCNSEAFAEDVESLAAINFVRAICTYKFEGLTSWLQTLAKNAIIDEWRKHYGRGKERKPVPEPMRDRSHSSVPQMFYSKYWVDPSALVRDREIRELLVVTLKLHAQHSRRDRLSAIVVALYVSEKYSARDVAKKCKRTERTVYRLLEDDYPKIRMILEESFGITSPKREL